MTLPSRLSLVRFVTLCGLFGWSDSVGGAYLSVQTVFPLQLNRQTAGAGWKSDWQSRSKPEQNRRREREKSQSQLDAQLAFLGEEWAALAGKYDGPLVGRRRRPEVGKWRVATEEKTGEMEVASPSAMCGTWVDLPDVVVRRARRGQKGSGCGRCDPLFFIALSSSTGGISSFPLSASTSASSKNNKRIP